MTTEEKVLVKKSWAILRQIDPVILGDVFYSRLFLIAPEVQRLFKSPQQEQARKLVDTLSYVIARLDTLESVAADVAALARRHAAYGVQVWHYELVGNALIWTLKQGMGADWSPALEQAWVACYHTLSTVMIQSVHAD